MSLRVTSIGELATALTTPTSVGRVTRVFRNSAYVESEGGLYTLLRGGPRSPMTINVSGTEEIERALKAGDACRYRDKRLNIGGVRLQTEGAGVYRSELRKPTFINPITSADIVKGIAMLRLLYHASPPSLDIVGHKSFLDFVHSVVLPLGRGELTGLHQPRNYLALVGLGSGFTPSGDDLLAGFAGAYNHVARSTGAESIALPLAELSKRTVFESAMILDYAQKGYVDEGLERLILSSLGNSAGDFFDELLELTRRGHTSGIDMSLGVILSVAAVRAWTQHDRTLQDVLRALTGSRTL